MHEGPPPPPLSEPAAPSLPYRDRKAGLIFFGVLQIFFGILCLFMVGFMVMAQVMVSRSTGTPVSLPLLLPSVLTYLLFAIGFVWLGIGSIQCRRWARALMLILAWCWLLVGLFSVPMMAVVMPKALGNVNPPPGGQPLPPEALIVIAVVQILVMAIFFILVPGALVLFYRNAHVKATCEARDPERSWTDACPLPVLAVTCLLFFGAVMMVCLGATGFAVFPFFGMFLTGLPAVILMIGMAGPLLWIGRSWYRLIPTGWWALLVLMLAFAVSNVITFARADILEAYQKMGIPQAQIDMMRSHGWMTNQLMMWMSLAWVVPLIAYLLWTRRYFDRHGTSAPNAA